MDLPINLFTQRTGNARRLLSFLALLSFAVPLCRAADRGPEPKAELVAPGIWRIRFGTPEQLTPTHFRSAVMEQVGLTAMPAIGSLPLDLAKVSFQVADRGCSLLLPMDPHESIYGFGLHTELFDLTQSFGQAGRRVSLKPTDAPENDRGESHAPVPFYVSTGGYGVFVDTARAASFYTGNIAPVGGKTETGADEVQTSTTELYRARARRDKTMLVDVPVAKGVDVYVFAGPTMLDAVKRYNLFSGGGAMPPLWGLGIHYRGYAKFGAEESLRLAKRLRDQHMPCDVWGVEPGWQTRAYSCSFVWNTNQFPNPDEFLAKMRAMGFRMNFWEHAFTHPESPIHEELKPWAGNFLVWNGLVPDFASPPARKIFLRQNRLALFDRGVEGVKLDECDDQPEAATPWSFPPATMFPSGLDGELMHSLIGVLYQQTMMEPCQEKGLRTWGLVRNSHALASSLPYVIYSDSYNARCYVRGLVNEGFSGLLWTPEVRDADSVEDLYRRLETVCFSPNAVINAWFIKNPPWDQVNRDKNNNDDLMPEAERQALTEGVRQVLQLRMRFVPYLYSAFNEYRLTGKPPVRALVLDWPEDAKARQIDDQFMFGDAVLAAPMFAGQKSRPVYLPAGDWYDFWTHHKVSGGSTIQATNGVGQIPLFVKGGALLPLAQPVESIQTGTCFDITVNIVGEQPADFTLYEDDGVTTAFAKGEQNQIKLHAEGDKHSVQSAGSYRGPSRYKISAWKPF